VLTIAASKSRAGDPATVLFTGVVEVNVGGKVNPHGIFKRWPHKEMKKEICKKRKNSQECLITVGHQLGE
jgi:hypothetical protein